MRPIRLLALLPILGCAPEMGIWLLEIEAASPIECEETLAHNFIDVVPPATETEDPNWTEEDNGTESPELVFVQVEKGGGNLCVMLWGNKTLPGTCDGSNWQFEWSLEDVGDSSRVHALGYTYSHEYDYLSKTKLSLETSGESASGNLNNSTATSDSFVESDMWAQAVGVQKGRMPVGRYLNTRSTDEEGNPTVSPTSNSRPNGECAASECTLDATEACSTPQRSVHAYYYDYGEEPNYENLKSNAQSSGFPQQPAGNGNGGGGGSENAE
jgi:hypothetical protein